MNAAYAAADHLWHTVISDVLHDKEFSFGQSNLGPTADSTQNIYSETVQIYFKALPCDEQADWGFDAMQEANTPAEFFSSPWKFIELSMGAKIEGEINRQIALMVRDARNVA